MSNRNPYGSPAKPLPGKKTLLAAVVLNTPTQGFADVSEICNRVGKNPRSMRSTISMAVSRQYIEPINPRHTIPQAYRLTSAGQIVKYALVMGD